MKQLKMSWREWAIAMALIVTLAFVLIPALGRSREASRRASCANNLRQLGIVLKMFSNESRGEMYPRLSPVANNWMFDLDAVYPEYLTDLSVLVCPKSPYANADLFALQSNALHSGVPRGTVHPDCVSSLFYTYLGYAVTSDEQALALFDAYYTQPFGTVGTENLSLVMPVWENSGRVKMPGGSAAIPLMWDRVPLYEEEFSHQPLGGNILHKDGHVEFVRYSYYNNSNYFPMTRLTAETYGTVFPRMSSDCYAF